MYIPNGEASVSYGEASGCLVGDRSFHQTCLATLTRLHKSSSDSLYVGIVSNSTGGNLQFPSVPLIAIVVGKWPLRSAAVFHFIFRGK